MNTQMRIARACFLVAAVGSAAPALATEGGGNQYPIGVNTVLPAVMPPPGHGVWEEYNLFYTASQLNGSSNKSAVPGFNVNVYVTAPRFLYTWDKTFGPFSVTSGFVQPIIYGNVSVAGLHDGRGGFADFTLQPLYLNYVSPDKTFMANLGIDLFFPTGTYNRGHLFNPGFHTYAFDPNLTVTWFPDKRTEVSASLYSEIHSTNDVTRYHSGAFINLDYGVDYKVAPERFPTLFLGLGGYLFNQVTNDTIGGVPFQNGYRGHAFALGPQVVYGIGHAGFALKWQHEFWVENRPQGERIWFQFAIPL